MSIERLVREALEDSVKDLHCPEPDLEQLVTAGRAMRRRRVGVVAGLAAAAVLVLVLAGLSFAWAGRSGRALEPVPASPPVTSAPIGAAFRSELQQWIDALPAGGPPASPYWHDGILYVNGVQIRAPYKGVDIEVVGDAVLVGGYESEARDGAAPTAWALVRGDRLEPLPVPAGAHPPGLSADGRIAYWVEHQGTKGPVEFVTWDTETNTALPSRTLQRGADGWDGLELLGVDAAGSGYWKASLSDPYLTRWDVRADTIHPTDLAYDTMQAPEEVDGFFPWMHWQDKYRSPDGTREIFTDSVPWDSPSDCCIYQLRVRPVGPDDSLDPQDVITLPLPKPTPATRFLLGEMDGHWVWWESTESVLLTLDGDVRTYLVRCSTTGGSCQRVVDLGTDTPERDPYTPGWGRNWGFARAVPVSQ